MRRSTLACVLTPLLGFAPAALSAQAPASGPALQAKYLKLLARYTGSEGRVACTDRALASELSGLGIGVDPKAPLAWAATEEEVRAYAAEKRLVVCPRLEWLAPGGAIAIVDEAGHPNLYFHAGHLEASGRPLDPRLLKIMNTGH